PTGQTFNRSKALINNGARASWDHTTNTVRVYQWGANWMQRQRVVNIALFDPNQLTKPGKQTIKFNNFGLMFTEAQTRNSDPVTGRFLYYVSGSGTPGTTGGSLVKGVQLVRSRPTW